MPIRVLPPQLAAKIAAGEVVERPASVVKELVENSLDAGATHVTVEVQGGGLELIRVTDDGEGIPVLDLEMAVERHATSKISTENDLQSIATMGFRGEALPSIAAVSRLTLTSRARGVEQGAYLRVRDSVVERKGAAGCPEGTSVTVQGLFENVPARRKFMRSAAAEAGRIHSTITQLAMGRPDVRFQLMANGKETFVSPGNGELRDTLACIYDATTAEAMLKIAGADPQGRHAWGYASPPTIHRANRSAINFYVNRRWIQSRLLLQAVEEAYRNFLMDGQHPIAVLHVELPAEEVDVNVHPTKREVRFHQEGVVFSLVQRALRAALVAESPVPIMAVQPAGALPQTTPPRGKESAQEPLPWQSVIPAREATPGETTPAPMRKALSAMRVVGQAAGTYIIAEGSDGVYLIDQHAAHERVQFERVMKQAQERQPDIQGLLAPFVVDLTPGQIETLHAWGDTLTTFGFQGEPFGDGSYLLRGVPRDLRDTVPQQLLTEVLDIMSKAQDTSQAREALAASIACHSSVRAGDALTSEEMSGLVRQLEAAASPHTCPHGRPTMLHLSAGSLARGFGRR